MVLENGRDVLMLRVHRGTGDGSIVRTAVVCGRGPGIRWRAEHVAGQA
jgi:hypothetical protein